MSKLELTKHCRSWGRTSERVLQRVETSVFGWNTPPPFETAPVRPSLNQIEDEVKTICDEESARSRKGMMNTSHFSVRIEDGKVNVYHLRVSNPDKLFLTIK